MRSLAALAAIALAGSTTLSAQETQPLTKITARAMPQEVLARRLFGDLGRIMLPAFDHGRPGVRPTRPLNSLEFVTVPIATSSPGLCRSSAVTVDFEPDGPLAGADTPVRPTGFETSQFYVIADFERLRRGGDLGEAERQRLGIACAAVDPRQHAAVDAPNEQMLVADVRILADLVDAARAGSVPISLTCPVPTDQPPVGADACRQTLAQLDLRAINAAGRCDPPPATGACFRVGVEGSSVRFESDSTTAPPSRVVLEPMIVVADERID